MNYLNANKVIVTLPGGGIETFEVGRGAKEIRYINEERTPYVMVIKATRTLLYFHPHIFSMVISDDPKQQAAPILKKETEDFF